VPGSFFGIEIGLRGLRAHQQALDVVAHNVANASAPGYTRQEARMQATQSQSVPGQAGQFGSGVTVYEIQRMRDVFLDDQMRSEQASYGKFNALKKGLDEIQTFFNEPSDLGLGSVMDKFWASLQDVANNPESDGFRRTAVQAGEALAEAFRHTRKQLADLQLSITTTVREQVSEMNLLAQQIAKANSQISEIGTIPGEQPNDLKDKRDLLIDRLAGLVKINATADTTSSVSITIGNVMLVAGASAKEAVFSDAGGEPHLLVGGAEVITPGSPGDLGGESGGLLNLRDSILPAYCGDLDTLAEKIVSETNALHRAGWGLGDAVHVERDFFSGTDARTISVSAALSSDPSKLAASRNGLQGDGSVALQMARVKENLVMRGATATFSDFLRGVVGRLGVQAQEAQRFVENETLLIKQIENHRQDVQGVSIDEEMSNMVRFQHAYTACARIITAFDEALSTLIERTGVVGR